MSFATYASQFLKQGSASTSNTAQPLFFSFTTDEASVQLDDADDPHFGRYSHDAPEEAEDPYLRLDDDEEGGGEGNVGYIEDDEEEGGWLANQRTPEAVHRPLLPQRTTSPPTNHAPQQPQSLSLGLSESLLPRTEPHAFHLPYSRRRKPQPNAYAAATFLFGYTALCVCAIISLVLANSPEERPPPALLHTIPLLTFLTILSAILAYIHLALLRAFLRPVLLISALAPPFALFLSAIIAFAGSFSAGAGWGLRLFALVPLALAVISVRRLPEELRRAARSPALLSISARILFFRAPLLLVLSPLILLVGLILSLPILTLLVRLPLSHSWYMQLASVVVAACALHVFFVARSIQRSLVAGGIGAWYFRYSIPAGAPNDVWNTGYPELDSHLRIIHAALLRPLGPIVLSALFSLILSTLSIVQVVLYWLPLALPYRFIALFADIALSKVHALGERIGGGRYTGVYCGLTGASFWDGVRGVRDLRSSGSERAVPSLPLPRPYTLALPFALVAYLRTAGDRDGQEGISYIEQQRAAVVAAVLAGLVCAAVSVFCAGVVRDSADTLYVCHLIDRAADKRPEQGDEEREAVWGSFDPSPPNPPQDAEAAIGLPLPINFNFGGLNLGGLFSTAGPSTATEQGGRGEEPVYARLRRTSLSHGDDMPPSRPPPASRGFRPPSKDFSSASAAVRNYSPPPRIPSVHSSIQRQESLHSGSAVLPGTASRDSDDVDSLDSNSEGRGGESSSAFPGSGFF
ncbi:hypothetical protein MIND_00160600 [Mycena indigotica]|uniref:Protein PNS1 n=1 Tax=Mycena indigotica TaxID=2126181 RepID=A0A8H6TEU4_9AGAR|nr:uncharacterized protein MIND_00160600 [Mycena indigotica]KAF7316418.1 hypothetical protein MIND_00160600 [Mycena indigotica]